MRRIIKSFHKQREYTETYFTVEEAKDKIRLNISQVCKK